MSNTIKVPTRDQVDAKAQGIFDNLKSALGFVPNLFAVIGNSSNTLESFLNFSGSVTKETFSSKEEEAIKVAVSEINGCIYCLSAHSAGLKMHKFSEAEILNLRQGRSEDPKLNAVVALAQNIAENRGKADQDKLDAFLAAGYNEKALIDLVATISAVTFTNYIHGVTKVPVDFPVAVKLEEAVLS